MTGVTLHKVSQGKKWMIRWYCDGKRHSETIGDCAKMSKRDANAIRNTKYESFRTGKIRADKPNQVTVAELIDQYVAAHKFNWRPRTEGSALDAGKHLVAAVGGDMIVSQFNGDAVRLVTEYLQAPRSNGKYRSTMTVNSNLVRISAMFDWAADEGQYFIRANPFATRSLKKQRRKVKRQRSNVRIYSSTEVEAIIAECPTLWWEAFVLLAVGSGLRLGELVHLQWDDLDLAPGKGRVKVTAKRAGSFTVDGRAYPVLEFETKAHSERSMEIADQVVEVLQRLKARTQSRYLFLTLKRLDAIAAGMKAGTLREGFSPVNGVLLNFQLIQRRAFSTLSGDHPIGTVHDCRRTYCTVMADVVPAHRLMKLAGHADIKTTLGFYIHIDDAYADQIRGASLGRPEQDSRRTVSPKSTDIRVA